MSANATPQRLYLFQLGVLTVPTPDGPWLLSSGCYLARMSDGQHILIDSGMPADYTPPPGSPPIEHEKSVLEHLADLKLRPDDVDMLICTHFDVDHIGYNDAFTRAELIVQRKHYEVARSGHPRYAPARPHWDHPALHYRLVDGDTELLPGLTLLETSGHAPAHQSVLIRLPQTGPILLTIDAAMTRNLFTPDRKAGAGDDNEEELRASVRKLMDVVEREKVALVIFGHDGEQWSTLKKAPEYYD